MAVDPQRIIPLGTQPEHRPMISLVSADTVLKLTHAIISLHAQSLVQSDEDGIDLGLVSPGPSVIIGQRVLADFIPCPVADLPGIGALLASL